MNSELSRNMRFSAFLVPYQQQLFKLAHETFAVFSPFHFKQDEVFTLYLDQIFWTNDIYKQVVALAGNN